MSSAEQNFDGGYVLHTTPFEGKKKDSHNLSLPVPSHLSSARIIYVRSNVRQVSRLDCIELKVAISRILSVTQHRGPKISDIVFDIPIFVSAEGVPAEVVISRV